MVQGANSIFEVSETILCIIVLYNVRLAESSTYRSLQKAMCLSNGIQPAIAVYDNSPIRQVSSDGEAGLFAYKHDPSNGGIAPGYNWAFNLAEEHGIHWLLLLDQDSKLPASFFDVLQTNASMYHGCEEIAGIVPHVYVSGSFVSPCRVALGRLATLPSSFVGPYPKELTAINAGALLRTSFIKSAGGFDESFRLDFLDHWLFHEIHTTGKSVVVSESIVEHDLAVRDYRNKIDDQRYLSIVSAESRFVQVYKSPVERAIYPVRLLLRALKQLFIYRKPTLARMTVNVIFGTAIGSSSKPGRVSA